MISLLANQASLLGFTSIAISFAVKLSGIATLRTEPSAAPPHRES